MLKLTYNRKSDNFATVTVLGDPDGIRDLYWQLTHNYRKEEELDGTGIGDIKVTTLDGVDVTKEGNILYSPHQAATKLSNRLD